uniref:Uncharacterized protein n=1 Tax=Avena sativa TaxID=4498 RepID=A0ACD5T6W2_AVESA
MWPSLRRAARSKNVSHVFPVCSGSMDSKLTGGGLRDSGCQLLSQVLPLGYPESVFPTIRRFSADSRERLTNSKLCDELPGHEAADQPDHNFDHNDEPSHANVTVEASKKPSGTKASISRSWSSNMDHGADLKSRHRTHRPYLFQPVLDTPSDALVTMLDRWIGDGNQLEINEVLLVLFHLKKQKLYGKALKFLGWIEGRKLLKFEEREYACLLDLTARNSGIEKAQKYLARVPKPFRNELLYETLLVSCVRVSDIQKAEEVFREIRNLSLPLTVSACNQMILLYKRVARNKVIDILMLMEKENIKPSPFTYKLIIDLKGRSNDMSGVELVLNEMKASGVELDFATRSMVARFYIYGGLTEKAEAVIREMEMGYIKDKRHAIRSLLHLYADLSKPGEVARIWKLCTEPNREDFLAAIEAWGKLGCIEQAEKTFEAMLETTRKVSSRYYNVMLSVYAENKLMAKGKEFVERMSSDGCPNSPVTWEVLIKLYVNSGEVGKADSFLLKVTEENPDRRPTYGSYIYLLRAYAENGDIHNAEKIFDRLKKVDYPGRKPPYDMLLEAYVNAKVRPHGFRERMRADGVHPVKIVIERLKFLDQLPKGGVPELEG